MPHRRAYPWSQAMEQEQEQDQDQDQTVPLIALEVSVVAAALL